MKQEDVLGRIIKDKVTLREGLCVGTLDWMFGCRIFIAKPRMEKVDKDDEDKFGESELHIPEPCLEIVDSVPAIDAGFPSEESPKFFGKICRDKITGYEGMCIGRVWIFYSEKQYCIQGKYSKKKLRKPSAMWLDEGRIEVIESDDEIAPEEVQTEYRGGCLDIPLPGDYVPESLRMGLYF